MKNSLMVGAALMPPNWKGQVTPAMEAEWAKAGIEISSDSTSIFQRSEIFSAMVQRIGQSIYEELRTDNPLSFLRDGSFSMGEFMQKYGVDVGQMEEFTGYADRDGNNMLPSQFQVQPSREVAIYHAINRKNRMGVTIPDPNLRQAFVEEGALFKLVLGLMHTLDATNTVVEYVYAKKLISDALSSTGVGDVLQPTQIIEIPDIRNFDTTQQDTLSAIKQIDKGMRSLCYNSRDFNALKRMQASRREEIECIFNYRANIQNNVGNLASLYNPEMSTLGQNVREVDDFGDRGDDLIGVAFERGCFNIQDNLDTTNPAIDARNLVTTHWKQIWQRYMYDCFKNVVFFVAPGTKSKYLPGGANYQNGGKLNPASITERMPGPLKNVKIEAVKK